MRQDIPEDRAAYRILTNFYGPNDHMYQEGDIVLFDGEPNDDMEPMNSAAKKVMDAFFKKQEDCARKMAEKAGREYTGRPRSLDEAVTLASMDARRVQLVQGDGGVPLMGGKKKSAETVERIDITEVPQTGVRGRRGILADTRVGS